MRQIFFDTETTGIGQGHRILELGAVESIKRELTGSTFHRIINPQREIDEEAIEIHRITQEIVQDKPLFVDVVDDFLEYIEGAELIIHNAPFDVKMVNNELSILSSEQGKDYGQIGQYCQITDSLELARKEIKSGKRSLNALCDLFHIDRSERVAHSAIVDCSLLFHVYIALTKGQKELFAEETNSRDALQVQKPLEDYRNVILPRVVVSPEEKKKHQEFIESYLT